MNDANKLNPGSPAAVAAGCTCAVSDNHHGRGYHGCPGAFSINSGCPLHGKKEVVSSRRSAKLGRREKTDTQQSAAFKQRLAIGSSIARQLPSIMDRSECARRLGISFELCRRTEYLALHKLYAKFHELRKQAAV
jgi:hypothetical protein